MSGYNSKKRKARGTQSRGTGTTSGVRDPYAHSGTGIPGVTRGVPIDQQQPGFSYDGRLTPPGSTGERTTTTITDLSQLSSLLNGRNQNDMSSRYDQMLTHNAGNDSFAGLLAGLGIQQEQGLTGSQRDDWNKQLLDAMLQYYITQEQRQYNEGALAEQRLYDNPMNALARLMGAGISRDAAIHLLSSGSGSGSGSGSALISDPTTAPEGTSASQSALNGLQGSFGIAQTVFMGMNALSGLVNLGVSVPQALQQIQYLKNQNFMSASQVAAYKSAGKAYGLLKGAGVAADAFSSATSAIDAISKLASDGNQDAAQFIASGGVQGLKDNASFASHTLGDLYKSERSSEDYARMYSANMRKLQAEGRLAELSYDKLTQEILNAEAEYEQICASTEYQEAMTEATNALKLQYEAETQSINLANNYEIALQGTSFEGKTYLQWMSDDTIYHTVSSARISAKTISDEYADAMYREMFNSADAVAHAMALSALKSQTGLEFATKFPEQSKEWMALKEVGAYDWLDAAVKKNTSGNYRLPFGIGGSTSGLNLGDNDPLNPFKRK